MTLDGHGTEPHTGSLATRLNWLRAAVLGANDGVVSVAGLVVLVAGASTGRHPVLTAGVGGLTAGAISMALGEYVSVSTQRDTEQAKVALETQELAQLPDEELAELAQLYEARGLSPQTARTVAEELTANDALAAHLETELGINQDALASPINAAVASLTSFVIGGTLPLLAILLPPERVRIGVTFAVVLLTLAATGTASARLGGAPVLRAVRRVVIGGLVGLALTYGIGRLFGAH